MKGKFKLLGHMGLALFLVCAMVLALAPAAQAATAVTNVWVQFTTSPYNQTDTATDFTIHFTPATAMKRGVDTITVWFPDGATAMGPDNFSLSSAVTTASYYDVDRDGEAITYSATDCTSAATLSTSGYRITVTPPVDLDAGTPCSLRIETAAGVACANETSHTQYKIKVYTSKDTTPVLSDAFDIDSSTDGINAVTLAVSPDTAGSAGQYTFSLNTADATELTAGSDTLTFIFPYGTTVPSSIAADKVSFSNDAGASWSTGTTDATVNQKARMVTVTTPITLAAHASNNKVRFSTGANILNPTTATSYTDYYVFTSKDELQVKESGGFTIDSNSATKIGFDNDAISNYSDSAAIINCYSSQLYVQVQDTYGNLVDNLVSEPTVSFTTSQSSTGAFFTESGDVYSQISSSATTTGAVTVYYKDSAAGTVTLTASATGYTSGTWTMTIAPGVSVYDSNNNLIKTYAPPSTYAKEKTDGVHGGDYVNDAINASVAGDTVKLGDGIYEVDTVISLSKQITLTSENGASYTTLKPTADAVHAIQVTVSGTATNPVIIDGLTFQRLRSAVEFDSAVSNGASYDYVTVRNCSFNYVIPDNSGTTEAVVWVQTGQAAITSATVSNNTFSNCVTFNGISGGRTGVIQFYDSGGTAAMSGVTISGNTMTDCNDYGIAIGGGGDHDYSATITNNTITNGYSAIDLVAYENAVADTVTFTVTGNTITNPYNYGIYVEDTYHDSVTIKNNTITGCAGTNGAIRIEEDTADAVTVQYNHITGTNSAGYAIKSTGGTTNCKYNWYGSATGPAYTALTGATIGKSNPDGTGDAISDKVTYYPWLHKTLAEVVTDNASYQASNIKLASGWNTLSTPVKLISTADAVNELIPSGMTIGYYYDGGWQQITTGYVLSPCDAVYVKMSAATYVLLKFDASAFSNPSKALDAGWNLISLASLDASKNVDNTMACVDLTTAGLPGWSQVISPSMNAAQTDLYGAVETAWAESAGENADKTMQPGLGYWAYMQNAATLAGFELTPIAPDLD